MGLFTIALVFLSHKLQELGYELIGYDMRKKAKQMKKEMKKDEFDNNIKLL